MLPNGFVYMDEAVRGVFWDAKYAGSDNFVGAPVDGYMSGRVVGTKELADALCCVRDKAGQMGYCLLLWDAYRPQRAVDHFVRWCAQSEDGKTKERHYPNIERNRMIPMGYIAERSGHSRGSTVDLTLCDRAGNEVDMGGWFDLMDERSHHDYENLTDVQKKNRALLRGLMLSCGFTDYQNEWWHYRLKDEPYPDTCFDFPI